jgi:uncharacterized RDD family membrane protein YckC
MNCPQCGSEVASAFCPVCGTPVASATPAVVLSGWWRRVGATLVDSVLLFLPLYVAFVLVGDVAGVAAGAIVSFALQGAYMVRLLASESGQTIGNRVVATRVRDALTGAPITRNQALKRWAVISAYAALNIVLPPSLAEIPAMLMLLDCLFPLFDARKQTLHDKIAGTLVVRI